MTEWFQNLVGIPAPFITLNPNRQTHDRPGFFMRLSSDSCRLFTHLLYFYNIDIPLPQKQQRIYERFICLSYFAIDNKQPDVCNGSNVEAGFHTDFDSKPQHIRDSGR